MVPLRPPLVSRAQVAFGNAVAPVAAAMEVVLAGRVGTLLWAPRRAPFEPVCGLDLSVDGMQALLLLDSDPIATLVDLPISADELAALPSGLQATLIGQAIEGLIQRFGAATGLSPDIMSIMSAGQIAGASLPSSPGATSLGWRIVDAEGRIWLQGALWLAPALAGRIVDLAAGRPIAGPGVAVEGLVLSARIELGRTGLSAAELGALESGDVVLVKEHRWDEGRVTIIVAANLRHDARLADGALQVVGHEESGPLSEPLENDQAEGDPLADEAAVGDEGALADVDEVSVPVTFDLGRLELAIGELRRVTAGHVFDLARPLDGAVSLRVQGRLIGHGELVDIEGSLGVRVIEIFPRDHG